MKFFKLAGYCLWVSGAAWAEGKTWAVVVGINDYLRPGVPSLRYAVADAKLFARTLQDSLKLPPSQISLMTSDSVDVDQLPRSVNIAFRLDWLRERVGPEDSLIFYFAGHGLTVDGQPYLLTEEADNRSVSTLRVSALQGQELVDSIRRARLGRVWIVLDACRNQAGDAQLDAQGRNAFYQNDLGRQKSATLFSCKLGERSWESEKLQHGYYTYHLVEGLRSGAANPQGEVTLDGLARHVRERVTEVVRKEGQIQSPDASIYPPVAEPWLLHRVEPALAARVNPEQGTANYVAKMNLLQAQLDQQSALRVAAEKRAEMAESEMLELRQRLAILEKRLSDSDGLPVSPVAPRAKAYESGGLEAPEGMQALQQELQRLKVENATLQKRLSGFQSNASQLSSREVQLSSEWTRLETELRRRETELTTAPLQAQLSLYQEIRHLQSDQIAWLETTYGRELEQRRISRQVSEEVEYLRQQVEIQQSARQMYAAHLKAAESALKEAQLREQQARIRTQELTLELAKVEGQLSQASAEVLELRKRLAEREGQVRHLEDALEKRYQGTALSRNPWRVTRQAQLSDFSGVIRPPKPEAQEF